MVETILLILNYIKFLIFCFLFVCCSKKEPFAIENNKLSEKNLSLLLEKANDDKYDVNQKKRYAQEAFEIINHQKVDSLSVSNLFKVANRFYNIGDWTNFKFVVDNIKIQALQRKDTLNLAKSYSYLGDYYSSIGFSDSSYIYFYKAEKMFTNTNDKTSLAKVLLNKALLQFNESDFLGSEKTVVKTLRLFRAENTKDVFFESYNLLGIIYNELEEFDKALEFHKKALNISKDKEIPSVYQSRATSLNNIGYVYQNLQNHKKSQEYYLEGLQQKNLKYDKPSLYAMLLDNLAYSRFRLNQRNELPELFLKSLKLRDSLKLTSGIVANKIHLSEYYNFHKDNVKALQYAKEALFSARKDNNYRNVLIALKQMGVVEPQNATRYSKEYIQINDSLQKAERKMGEKFSRIEYETDVLKSENTDLVVQNRNLFYVFSILTLLGLFTFAFMTQKNKHKLLMFKEQQQLANAEIYNLMISQQKSIEENRTKEKKRVARELHDGVLGKIFGVRMNLDGMNAVNDEKTIKSRLKYLAELKQIEQDIREISHDMNRENSELINNFVVILTNLIEHQRKAFKTKVRFSLDKNIDWANITNEVKINLYRIVQEALQNSNKYASPTLIKVEFVKEYEPSRVILSVSDDGKGFNLKKAKKGIGLQNIEFRTKECKGKLELITKLGHGTLLNVEIPIES